MAYDSTEVPVSRSQEGIRKLIMGRKGSRVAFVTDPPNEGFEAIVMIDDLPYQIRISGECRQPPESKGKMYKGRVTSQKDTTDKFKKDFLEKEERRIWRVLYYHLKSVFEAADSGVMEFKSLMLPYLVTKSGKTIAECIVPQLQNAIDHNPARMLGSGN